MDLATMAIMSVGKRTIVGLTIILASCLVTEFFAANILISAIYGEGSHFLAAACIGESLVERGHKVTFLISNAYAHRAEDPQYSNMSFEIFEHPVPVEEARSFFQKANEFAFEDAHTQLFHIIQLMTKRMVDDCEAVITNHSLMERLAQNDVILFDTAWPCVRYMKAVFDQRHQSNRRRAVITFSATSPWSRLLKIVGSTVNLAYQPEITTGYSNRMGFSERMFNVFQSYLLFLIGDRTSLPRYQQLGKKLGLDPNIHPIYDMADYDLHLLNVDFASEFPMPLSPNIIPVGGVTVRSPNPLDEDLEAFMQSSGDHGVIVFSLGTYLASIVTIKPELVRDFAEAFRRLPQKVVWQLKQLPAWELPPNVKTMPWLPQNDLLGHPKTRAFVFQGGNNGFQEACYHGVPMVVMPLHGDQDDVAARIVTRGLGKKINKRQLSPDIIYEALNEVISNPSYNATAKQVSAMYKDNPMSARDRAAFWIEHVIKFGGSYLRPPVRDLNFVQYHLLDVFGFLALIVIIIAVVIFYILRCALGVCCRMIGRGSSMKSKRD